MRRMISYDELPSSQGETLYLRMETDPALYINLLKKGYKIVNHIRATDEETIYVTGKRQDIECINTDDYKEKFDSKLRSILKKEKIDKPKTLKFSFQDLIDHKYKLPFVLKNEYQNGGREKFLIETEEDYENLIKAFKVLLNKKAHYLIPFESTDKRRQVDYEKYIDAGFMVQEYINSPTEYNTSIRLLTTPSGESLYAFLKYNEPRINDDDTTILGYLLREVFPLSTKTIMSNSLSGGQSILIGDMKYSNLEKKILDMHHLDSELFHSLVNASLEAHYNCRKELGIICAFDYIYNSENNIWYLLEYHSRPMVGDFAHRNNVSYRTSQERIIADGRVRATALSMVLKKTR